MASSCEEEDLCCPACQDVFVDPVILPCSHSFCRGCLMSWWRCKKVRECPVCRSVCVWGEPPRNLALKNLCEAFLQDRGRKRRESIRSNAELCGLHSERFKLFCVDHAQPVCVVCRDAKTHSDHHFQPIDEAAIDRRKNLQKHLTPLQEKLKSYSHVKSKFTQTLNHIKLQFTHAETQIEEEFERLREFLEEEKEARIGALKKEEEEKSKRMERRFEEVDKEMENLSETVKMAEQHLKSDDVSFLLHYNAAVDRIQKFPEIPENFLPEIHHDSLLDVASHLGNLSFHIWMKMKDEFASYSPVILDPNTAHPELNLCDDLTSVKRSKKTQNVPENPERFEYWDSVFGSAGFESGAHEWEVLVGENKDWELGLCVERTCRKGFVGSKVWSIELNGGKYRVFSSIDKYTYVEVSDRRKLQKVRVRLDWERGELGFYDGDTDAHIHTFTHTFSEKLCPYLCTRHTLPLKILPLKVQVSVER